MSDTVVVLAPVLKSSVIF